MARQICLYNASLALLQLVEFACVEENAHESLAQLRLQSLQTIAQSHVLPRLLQAIIHQTAKASSSVQDLAFEAIDNTFAIVVQLLEAKHFGTYCPDLVFNSTSQLETLVLSACFSSKIASIYLSHERLSRELLRDIARLLRALAHFDAGFLGVVAQQPMLAQFCSTLLEAVRCNVNVKSSFGTVLSSVELFIQNSDCRHVLVRHGFHTQFADRLWLPFPLNIQRRVGTMRATLRLSS